LFLCSKLEQQSPVLLDRPLHFSASLKTTYPSPFLSFKYINTQTLISPSLSSTTHIVNPILTLLLDQIRSSLELFSQWNFACLLGSVGKVVGQNHLVDVYTGDSSFDTFGEDFGDEFVCAVEDYLDSVVDLFLDCCETGRR
jgi:hypothetical protein